MRYWNPVALAGVRTNAPCRLIQLDESTPYSIKIKIPVERELSVPRVRLRTFLFSNARVTNYARLTGGHGALQIKAWHDLLTHKNPRQNGNEQDLLTQEGVVPIAFATPKN